jgi:predicted DNA-binding transcriptional regulator YafY
MRAGRLLSILLLLQLRVRLTAEQLAQEFEVSVRTIYRDIEQLCAAGIPILSDRGPGGGFQLVEGFRTKLTGLAAPEAEALLMIGLPQAAATIGLGAAAKSAERKLLASLPAPLSEEAQRLGARFHFDPIDWYRSPEASDRLPLLARAVLDQHPIEMTYSSWTATREWRVEPLGLVLKAGRWYLVAGADQRVRIFNTASIQKLQLQAEHFTRPDSFDLTEYWSSEIARFEAQLRPLTATVRLSKTGFERVAQLGAYAVQALDLADPPDEHGWRRVRLPIENDDQAALMLLGIGPEFEVIEPESLRERVGQVAGEIGAKHHGNG